MPTDVHGQTHAGSLGLFDDDTEHDNATARAERHEYERLEGVIRRQERRDARQSRKDQKAAEHRAAAAAQGKSKLLPRWLGRLFGGGGGKDLSSDDATPPARPVAVAEGQRGRGIEEERGRSRIPRRNMEEYVIVRRPETPEPVYTGEDVDAVDSPWLRECGMVRVKSDDPGGCHIVPKSVVQKNE
ncbi:hypothetical protein N0V83_009152 [Neocucurbitaria cava]|uniref:Uncharacterized protein n=1 Tax=Neocucurbitaria cava TaxID=798079 RepID=A0A9W8Y217_9PLEO|nr:hypothetical protein N0V83_009152 [Neocucurbitaria cava]